MAGPGHFTAFALVALAASFAGVLVGRLVPKRKAAPALGPFVLAALLYASCRAFPEWEATVFPWPGYAFWQRQWIYPLGLFILGCGGAMLPVRWNRLVIYSVAAGLLAWSLHAGSWMLRAPCPGRTDPPVRGMIVEQSTTYTCAPAACATLLAAWGIERSENEMAQLCLCVPAKGTTQFDIYRGLALAARGSALRPRLVGGVRERLGTLVRPFIVTYGGHAIVVFQVRGDKMLIGDPFVSWPVWRSMDAALETWDGVAILLCRRGPFDGRDAPHLGAWLANARDPRRPAKELRSAPAPGRAR